METTKETGLQLVEPTVIETALATKNVTTEIINKLKSEYSGLKINGLDDKETFNKVEEGRKKAKKLRCLAVEICETGREKANQESKDWLTKQKEVVAEISVIEDELKKESDRINELEKQILFEAAQKEKLPTRKEKLLTIEISVEDSELLKIDDVQFDKLYNEFYITHLEEKAAALKLAEEKRAEELALKLAEEKRISDAKIEIERLEAKKLADAKIEEQRIENERLKKINDAAEKVAAELKLKADAELAEVNRLAKIESDKQAKIIADQKIESDRLAAELKLKADAELKAKQELEVVEKQRLADEKKAAKAPDKQKMKLAISGLNITTPDLHQKESAEVMEVLLSRFEGFKAWALLEIDKL